MALNRMKGALMMAGSALALFALFAMLSAPPKQDAVTLTGAHTEPVAGETLRSAPQLAGQAPDSLQPCDTVSPFGKAGTPCIPLPEPSLGNSAQDGGSADMIRMPDFVNVQVVGGFGGGVVGTLLQSAGRALSGTPQNHDSTLIDVSAMKDSDVAASMKEAIDSGKYVIVDGGDSMDGSTKLNQIMLDRNLISIQGVTAYGVIKGVDDKIYVTPLLSVADKNGTRAVDQIRDVLGINKS